SCGTLDGESATSHRSQCQRDARGRRSIEMTRGRTLAVLVGAIMLVSSALAGLAGHVSAQESSERPTLRFGVNAADLATLDPHFASGTQDRTVVDMIFNGLVRFKPGNSAEM